jgi:hypothetical protein
MPPLCDLPDVLKAISVASKLMVEKLGEVKQAFRRSRMQIRVAAASYPTAMC